MKIWKVILATLVIFGMGVITGGLLVGISDGVRERRQHWLESHKFKFQQAQIAAVGKTNREPSRLTMPSGVPNRRQFPKDFLDRLNRELKLTPDQHQQIDQVLDNGQKRTKELWDRIATEVHEEMKNSQEKILKLLTPEQKSRFEELMKPRQNKIANQSPKPGTETPATNSQPPTP